MKAFTMIELIFVIVILGVLAAVAVPKLSATRDDAQIVTTTKSITVALTDIVAYYTAKGNFSNSISDMTSVNIPIQIKDQTCANFVINSSTMVTLQKFTDGLCETVWSIGALANVRNIAPDERSIVIIEQ